MREAGLGDATAGRARARLGGRATGQCRERPQTGSNEPGGASRPRRATRPGPRSRTKLVASQSNRQEPTPWNGKNPQRSICARPQRTAPASLGAHATEVGTASLARRGSKKRVALRARRRIQPGPCDRGPRSRIGSRSRVGGGRFPLSTKARARWRASSTCRTPPTSPESRCRGNALTSSARVCGTSRSCSCTSSRCARASRRAAIRTPRRSRTTRRRDTTPRRSSETPPRRNRSLLRSSMTGAAVAARKTTAGATSRLMTRIPAARRRRRRRRRRRPPPRTTCPPKTRTRRSRTRPPPLCPRLGSPSSGRSPGSAPSRPRTS